MTIENHHRRSFVHPLLEQAGAEFAEIAGGNVALNVGNDESAAADIIRRMGLVDLSPLPRIGYKGVGAPQWLRQQSLQLPLQANSAVTQTDGTLVAALSAQEHLLLSPYTAAAISATSVAGASGICQRVENAWSLDSAAQCYQLPRADSHCWFAVCGSSVGEMLPKLCGVDLRPHVFADNAVAQTSLARVNAIIIRQTIANTAVFHLLTDSASAEYLWRCLLDAMAEFDGAVVGLNALQSLHND